MNDSQTPKPLAGSAGDILVAKSMNAYRTYGWRAKIGIIVPSTNVCTEAEWAKVVPEGVSFHTARALLQGATSQESYDALASSAEKAAFELGSAEIDLLAFVCTSGSFMVDRDGLNAKLAALASAEATTTAHAVLRAFEVLGVSRVALATPYLDVVNERERDFLSAAGIEVVASSGLQIGRSVEERRLINRIPPEVVYRMAVEIDTPKADAIFLSCTALPTLAMIDRIEDQVGKPVIASNPVTLWDVLRKVGLSDRIHGYGRLLREF